MSEVAVVEDQHECSYVVTDAPICVRLRQIVMPLAPMFEIPPGIHLVVNPYEEGSTILVPGAFELKHMEGCCSF